jgi:RHS repeat-associated protein
MGPLPPAGQWARLEVPAAAVGLEGQTVHGLAVTLYDGRATWDKLGKGSVRWLVSDHLGTPRMTVDATGSLLGVTRHDYLPFGEEISAGTGGRTTGQGYAADNVRQQFTGKERDAETNLDYFVARYYSPTQGRFTGFDPGPFNVADPQSWNRYSYVQNNPLKFIDPNGEELFLTGEDADYIRGLLEKYTGYKLNRDKKTGLVTVDSGAERNSKGTSEHLADKLKEIANPENKLALTINVGSNLDSTTGDSFRDQAIDAADYRVYERDAPELSGALLGHVLDEYYEAKKDGADPKTISLAIFGVSYHNSALAFEGKVLSDLTGKEQGPRVPYPGESEKGRRRGVYFRTDQYVYNSVTYDILFKTVVTSPGGRRRQDNQVTGVKRR